MIKRQPHEHRHLEGTRTSIRSRRESCTCFPHPAPTSPFLLARHASALPAGTTLHPQSLSYQDALTSILTSLDSQLPPSPTRRRLNLGGNLSICPGCWILLESTLQPGP